MSLRPVLLTKEEAEEYLRKLKERMENYRKEHPDATN